MNKWLAILTTGVTLILFSTLGLKLYNQIAFQDRSASPPAIQGKLFEAKALGEFQIFNQQGELVGNEIFKGKWSLLSYGYLRCPDICPTTLMVKRSVQQLLAEQDQQLHLVFLSVDPVYDGPAQLAQYLQYFGDITGLTADQKDSNYQNLIKDLAIKANTIENNRFTFDDTPSIESQSEDLGNEPVNHGIHLYLINPMGELQAVFFPKIIPTVALPQFNAAQITNDIIISMSFFNTQNNEKPELISKVR